MRYNYRRGLKIFSNTENYILTYSENRINGAIRVLKEEYKNIGEKLRALVITDFDIYRPGGSPKVMGSATKVFEALSKPLNELDPILVTGKRVYCDKDIAEKIKREMEKHALERNWDVKIKLSEKDGFFVVEGEGKDWKPSVYAFLITLLFEKGITKLLVGTKGIFGEGWDSIKLNTLIDLTAISFGTSVQQIRGRTIRLDKEDRFKVAHNWDIVAVEPHLLSSIVKLKKKHSLIYGIDDEGRILKGLLHLDKRIAEVVGERGIGYVTYNPIYNKIYYDINIINMDMLKIDKGRVQKVNYCR